MIDINPYDRVQYVRENLQELKVILAGEKIEYEKALKYYRLVLTSIDHLDIAVNEMCGKDEKSS
jgi:hypothetical protein